MLVLDDPLDDLGFLELEGAGHGGREVDVPLRARLPPNELDLGWVPHERASFRYLVV